MATRLRELREAAGLSQGELAGLAGVSRQAVGAVESGRHLPRVDAAVALAGALGVAVEELFPGEAAPVSGIFGAPLVEGEPLLVAAVGERLVCVPAPRAARPARPWPAADATAVAGGVRLLPGADAAGLVAVGCDPALGLAAGLLPRSGPRRLLAVSASSAAATTALGAGLAHVALVHGPAEELAGAEGAVRVELARWRVGLALARAGSLAELLDRGGAVVQRDPGAASQQAFLRALAGREAPSGPLAADHAEAAALVRSGAAAGVTMEPAALAEGLAFLPLEEHVAELRIAPAWLAHPGVQALIELVASAAFRERAGLVPGYDVGASGSVRAA